MTPLPDTPHSNKLNSYGLEETSTIKYQVSEEETPTILFFDSPDGLLVYQIDIYLSAGMEIPDTRATDYK